MKLAIMFNGQGAHFQGMGQSLAQSNEQAALVFQQASEVTGLNIQQMIHEEIELLKQTRYAQIAIATTSIALYRAIEPLLPTVSAFGGLSLGEYSALIASGALEQTEAWQLLKERGELMSAFCETIENAQMAAVIGMPIEEIESLVESVNQLDELYIANYNAPTQIVIAGTSNAIQSFKEQAKALGYRKVIPLKVEGPFHSPMMQPIQEEFALILATYRFNETDTSVWSNVTVAPHETHAVAERLVEHLTQPVKWYQTIDEWIAQGVTHIIQIGPGDTLAKLLASQYPMIASLVVNDETDVSKVSEFLRGEL